MKTYKLDKTIAVDTDYTAEMDKGYVIKKVGTSSADIATLSVAGAPCLEIVKDLAPAFAEEKNLNPLLDLGDNYVVVPPQKKLRFSGSADSEIRLQGSIIELEPGEFLPAGLLARHSEQAVKFISYKSGVVTVAATAVWTAKTESKIIDFTCPAGEKWLFANRYQAEARLDDLVEVAGGYSQIRINDNPLDILDTAFGKKGIAGSAAPNPPRALSTKTTDIEVVSVNKVPATLEDMKLDLRPGVNLKVYLINTGADYTVPTGKTLNLIVHLVGERQYI